MILCVLSKAIMGYRTCTSNGMRRKDHQLKTCLKSNSRKYFSCVQSAVTATRDPIDISQFARRAHFARASGTETRISGFTVNISTWKFCSYEITPGWEGFYCGTCPNHSGSAHTARRIIIINELLSVEHENKLDI